MKQFKVRVRTTKEVIMVEESGYGRYIEVVPATQKDKRIFEKDILEFLKDK